MMRDPAFVASRRPAVVAAAMASALSALAACTSILGIDKSYVEAVDGGASADGPSSADTSASADGPMTADAPSNADGPSNADSGASSDGASADASDAADVGPLDNSQYNFENGTQSWLMYGDVTGLTSSPSRVFAGARSLAVRVNGTPGALLGAYAPMPAVAAGKTVTFHVWIPSGTGLDSIQAYVFQGADGGFVWTMQLYSLASLQTDAWNTLTVTVPLNAALPLARLGIEAHTTNAWSSTLYVDAVNW